MVVKSQIKLVKSLQQKKYRNQEGLFVAEGVKLVRELLESHFTARHIFTTDVSLLKGFLKEKDKKDGNPNEQDKYLNYKDDHSEEQDGQDGQDEPSDEKDGRLENREANSGKIELVSESELRKMSGLTTPNIVIGVFEIAAASRPDASDWILALDDVRDPGNLGTIIRLCDWFGIEHLVCSLETVDCYNPKVLQATMGSIARVKVGYTDLEDFLGTTELPIFGAFMDGEAVHSTALPEKGILVMGNESHGISPKVERLVSEKISIPQPAGGKQGSREGTVEGSEIHPAKGSKEKSAEGSGEITVESSGKRTAESLNVATATAILLHEIRRAR
ncbi:MAG: TrmH family RNA methyltransferase [Pricia sp.]